MKKSPTDVGLRETSYTFNQNMHSFEPCQFYLAIFNQSRKHFNSMIFSTKHSFLIPTFKTAKSPTEVELFK